MHGAKQMHESCTANFLYKYIVDTDAPTFISGCTPSSSKSAHFGLVA